MQIAINTNQITAPAAPANIVGGAGVSAVDGAENTDSVAFAPVEEVSISEAGRRISEQSPPVNQAIQSDTSTDSEATAASEETGISDETSAEQASGREQEASRETAEQRQQEADLAQIRQLKTRDAEVKAHEAAHAAVGGQLAGTPSYTYQRGPDGVRYAVAGEVPIDVSVIPGDPQATLEKMQQVQRAALAPAEPSSQDRQVAAQASQQAATARAEISAQQREQRVEASEDDSQDEQTTERADNDQQNNESAESRERVSAADTFSEQNARMRRINAFLLEISVPDAPKAGDLINAVA